MPQELAQVDPITYRGPVISAVPVRTVRVVRTLTGTRVALTPVGWWRSLPATTEDDQELEETTPGEPGSFWVDEGNDTFDVSLTATAEVAPGDHFVIVLVEVEGAPESAYEEVPTSGTGT